MFASIINVVILKKVTINKPKNVLECIGFEPTTMNFKITESHTLARSRYIALLTFILHEIFLFPLQYAALPIFWISPYF